jgi:hypothetical protein
MDRKLSTYVTILATLSLTLYWNQYIGYTNCQHISNLCHKKYAKPKLEESPKVASNSISPWNLIKTCVLFMIIRLLSLFRSTQPKLTNIMSSFRSTQLKLTTYCPHLGRLNLKWVDSPAQHTLILMKTTRLKYNLVFMNLTWLLVNGEQAKLLLHYSIS